jgi:hypothetical protein
MAESLDLTKEENKEKLKKVAVVTTVKKTTEGEYRDTRTTTGPEGPSNQKGYIPGVTATQNPIELAAAEQAERERLREVYAQMAAEKAGLNAIATPENFKKCTQNPTLTCQRTQCNNWVDDVCLVVQERLLRLKGLKG